MTGSNNQVQASKSVARRWRNSLEMAFLKTVRLYTFHTPIAKGKYRAFLIARKLCKHKLAGLSGVARDGRMFFIDLSSNMQDSLYFLGEYETVISRFVEAVIRDHSCKIFVDAGANFGWYTTLFAKHAGKEGYVHAFEPVPSTFDNLQRNFDLMGRPANVKLNNLALGEAKSKAFINVFPGEPLGHASLSNHDRSESIQFACDLVTLDEYLKVNNVGDVDFVKVDIEGAELNFLKGAESLFHQPKPPVVLMEMALNQTNRFGYLPNDLIQFLQAHADYQFMKIDETNEILVEIDGFEKDDIGANVLCIPRR
jgi:FkbM family methyltransferase